MVCTTYGCWKQVLYYKHCCSFKRYRSGWIDKVKVSKFNRKAHKEHGGWGERVGIYNTQSQTTMHTSVPMRLVAVGNTPQTDYPSDHDTEGSTTPFPELQHSTQSACALTRGPTSRPEGTALQGELDYSQSLLHADSLPVIFFSMNGG